MKIRELTLIVVVLMIGTANAHADVSNQEKFLFQLKAFRSSMRGSLFVEISGTSTSDYIMSNCKFFLSRCKGEYNRFLRRDELDLLEFRAAGNELIMEYQDIPYDLSFSISCPKKKESSFTDCLKRTRIPEADIDVLFEQINALVSASISLDFEPSGLVTIKNAGDLVVSVRIDATDTYEVSKQQLRLKLPQKTPVLFSVTEEFDFGSKFLEQLQQISKVDEIPTRAQATYLDREGIKLPADVRIVRLRAMNNKQLDIDVSIAESDFTILAYARPPADVSSIPQSFVKAHKNLCSWSMFLVTDPGTKMSYLYCQRNAGKWMLVVKLEATKVVFDDPMIELLINAISRIKTAE